MGKKRGILLAVLFVALLGGLVWVLCRPSEPAYQGKPLSAWLKELSWRLENVSHPDSYRTKQAAFVAFREMGTNAIPALLKIIQSGDPPFQRLILEVNRKQSLLHFPLRERWRQRWAASVALYAMGTNAKPAFPILTNLLFHTNEMIPSSVALAGMGSAGLPPLMAALTNQNASIRKSAANGLVWERSDLNLVVPALIARLSDQDGTVHVTAVIALGELHAEPRLAVPALMKDFPGKNRVLRSLILMALREFGTNASAAVPMLLETVSDNDQEVRTYADWALKQIDPEAAAKAGVK